MKYFTQFLKDITGEELISDDKLTPARVSEKRYYIMFKTTLSIVTAELGAHIKLWEKEEKMGGFLNLYYKNLILKRAFKLAKKICIKAYKYNFDNERKVGEIVDTTKKRIAKRAISNQESSSDEVINVNSSIEGVTLPPEFFTSFCVLMFSIQYFDTLEKTIEEEELKEDITLLRKLFNKYQSYIENEVVCTSPFKKIEEYKVFVEKVAFDTRRDKIMRGIRAYKEKKHIA